MCWVLLLDGHTIKSVQQRVTKNGTSGYKAIPSNIQIPIDQFTRLGHLVEVFAEKVNLKGDLRTIIDSADQFAEMGSSIFSIPSDADDTGCNLAVGAGLLKAQSKNPKFQKAANRFFATLSDPNAKAFEPYTRFAYRPFSVKSNDENVIDSRTYMWLREFLNERKESGDTDVVLITTWFQSVFFFSLPSFAVWFRAHYTIYEQISDIKKEKVYQKMPFNVNNVDGSVAVNGLYGIASFINAQPLKYSPSFTPDVYTLFDSTAALVKHILDKALIEKHAASILLYYPSRYAFYYFVTRLVKELQSASENADLPDRVRELFGKWHEALDESLTSDVTSQIIYQAKPLTNTGSALTEGLYWDDFLGNGDKKFRPEDRLFSTSMAFNALVNTWTVASTGKASIQWRPEAPSELQDIILAAGRFLASDAADHLPPENAFFSASVKSFATLPMFSVTNFRVPVSGGDGTESVPCTQNLKTFKSFDVTYGVQGVMNETEYELRAKEGCFGVPTQNPDIDYNW